MKREKLVIGIIPTKQGYRYKVIGRDLIPAYAHVEPPKSWFDATTQAIAKGNKITLTEAYFTNGGNYGA